MEAERQNKKTTTHYIQHDIIQAHTPAVLNTSDVRQFKPDGHGTTFKKTKGHFTSDGRSPSSLDTYYRVENLVTYKNKPKLLSYWMENH